MMLKCDVIGNLGGDPELRYAATGTALLRFNVAANLRVKNADNEWADKTEWLRVTVFGNRAESLATLLKKGTKVYVRGNLEARPWTDQQDTVRAGLEIRADDIELMTPRSADDRQPTAARQGAVDDDADLPF